jgi:hypothetical protein
MMDMIMPMPIYVSESVSNVIKLPIWNLELLLI